MRREDEKTPPRTMQLPPWGALIRDAARFFPYFRKDIYACHNIRSAWYVSEGLLLAK